MLVEKWMSFISSTLFLALVAFGSGCGCDEDDGNGNGNGNGFDPFAENLGGGGSGPSLFVDRDGDGLNDLCADVQVRASRATPVVTFVVDGSTSMDQGFRDSRDTRWNVMIGTLMDDPGGIVAQLQSHVLFGMVLFGGPTQNCPYLQTVQPAINNYDALNQAVRGYNRQQILYTPTALALEAAYALQPNATPDIDVGQHFIILCTDGNPNSCEAAQNQTGGIEPPPEFDGPIQQVTAGYNQGIETFVISLASGGQDYEQHLSQLAEIGSPDTPSFSPSTRGDLVAKIQQLVGGALGCQVTLNGKVTPGDECSGSVQLNGREVTCNDPNGWRLVDERTIELVGTACDNFMNNPTAILQAGFPCGVFTPVRII